ncbi:hypothetical protein Tco_0471419 [Tanacetum coccineum]
MPFNQSIWRIQSIEYGVVNDKESRSSNKDLVQPFENPEQLASIGGGKAGTASGSGSGRRRATPSLVGRGRSAGGGGGREGSGGGGEWREGDIIKTETILRISSCSERIDDERHRTSTGFSLKTCGDKASVCSQYPPEAFEGYWGELMFRVSGSYRSGVGGFMSGWEECIEISFLIVVIFLIVVGWNDVVGFVECRLYDDCCDKEDGSYGLKNLDAYSIRTTLLDDALPTKEKDPRSYKHVNANFFPVLSINVMSKSFYNSIMKEKVEFKGKHVVGAIMNVPIFVRNFYVITNFVVIENIDTYRDDGMGDIIVGRPFVEKHVSKQDV